MSTITACPSSPKRPPGPAAPRGLRGVEPLEGRPEPGPWSPPSRAYWCTYSRAWTHIEHTYQLTITEAERDQLNTMFDTCI
ncbi:hypothetical protein [Streptomyces sp. NPDC054952]